MAVVAVLTVVGCSSSGPAGGGATGGNSGAGATSSGGVASAGGAGGAGGALGSGGKGSSGVIGSGGGLGSGGAGTGSIVGSGGDAGTGGGGSGGNGTAGSSTAAGGEAGTGGAAGMDCPPLPSAINVPAATVSGTVTVNGARMTDDSQALGFLSLVRSSGLTIDQGQLATTSPTGGAYSALVVPGVYDLVYSAGSGGTVPVNARAVLQSGVAIGAAPLRLNIDVPATTVTLTATVKGAAMTAAAPFRQGGLALVNAAGDNALLTGTAATRGAYSALVIPGAYDLVYAGDTLGAGMPINSAAVIQSGIVIGTAGVVLQADVPATKVAITVTVNSTPATPPVASTIDLSLRTTAGDVAQLLPATATPNVLSALVVPGTYDLYYAISTPGDSHSHAAKVRAGIVVGASPLSMAVDVTATPVSCTATINGAAISDGNVELALQGTAGQAFPLATDGSPALVLPGTYDLVYRGVGTFGTGLPLNGSARLQEGVVVGASPVNLAIDIPAVSLSGAVTVNGSSPGSAVAGHALLTLVGAAGDSAIIGGFTPSYSSAVVAGTYDLVYRMIEESPDLPENAQALLKKGLVIAPSPSAQNLDIDVPAVALTVSTTVNGGAVQDPTGNARGVLQLYGANGDSAGFALVQAQPDTLPPALVVPGTYDLYYRVYNGSPGLPINSHGYLGCVTVR